MKKLYILFIWLGIVSCLNAQGTVQPDSSQMRYLAEQKELSTKFSEYFNPNYASLHRLSEEAFCAKIDSAATGFYALLNVHKAELPLQYVSQQQFEIQISFDKILVKYPYIHEIYSGERRASYPIIEKKLSNTLRFFNDPALLGNADLMLYIDSFLGYKINNELKKSIYNGQYNKRLNAMWNLLPRYFTDKRCLNYHRDHLLLDHITHNGVKYTNSLYALFKKECNDTSLTLKLEQVYRDSRNDLKDHQVVHYKKVGNYNLDLHIFGQGSKDGNNKKPVIVFFHGGSWSEGQPSWHFGACRKYAANGWVACSVEYRIYGSQGTLPFAAVMDARSAIRWLREHGDEFGIDTSRIVASGNSAGGHLVLATALADQCDEKSDNLRFSPVPDVLLVNSGVYDLTDEKTAWIRKDLNDKDTVKKISPNALVRKHLPPMLLIHSVVDQNVPYSSAQTFVALMQAAGNPFEFKSIAEGGHFIFDHPKYTPIVFAWRKEFLHKLGYPDCDGE
jgi:acetyl esterase/lipase